MTLATVVQLATLAALLVAIWQLRQARLQRQRNFESLFIQRYWKISDELSEAAQAGAQPDGGHLTSSDRQAVMSYFRLCEDQLELWQDGWISRSAWRQWSLGIDATLRRWPFSEVWRTVCERERPAGNDGQYRLLRQCRPAEEPQAGWPKRKVFPR